jgi:glycosyltransferase involved in cell wall biosynthesis
MSISILLPTRKRVPLLKKCVESLLDNASDPSKIQLLYGVDDDDQDTIDFLKDDKHPARSVIKFPRQGYENLHLYNNALGAYAQGNWIMFFNDDAIMQTKNWDLEINKFDGQFKLLKVKEQTGHPYSIFPIVPYDWFRCLDHLSLHGQNDAWVSEIAYMLDIMQKVDINVFHDRADITGNNDDDTFKERIYKEGNPDQEGDLHHQKMVNSRFADASKLSWFLEKIGQPSLHWKKIIKKEIKPFIKLEEKFLEYQKSGSLGAGKQNAKNSDQRETKVSNSTIQKN